MRFLAYLTKGSKEIAEEEIQERVTEAKIERSSEKYVIFESGKDSISEVLELKTIDDAHILLNFQKLSQKPDAETILEKLPINEINKARDVVREFRSLDDTFSLTTSKYRNNKVELDTVEEKLSQSLKEITGHNFVENRHSNFDVRIHLEENNILFSVRLTEKPLYFRDYWQEGQKGSLKTSIAAALCKLADPSEGEKLVDNFCGAGTILCEARLQGAEVSGGDIDREAIQCARKNLKELDAEASNRVKKLDAKATSQPENYFDIAVSNFPWGKQVDLNAVELYSEAIEEYSRILKDNGRIVILGKHPELAEKHVKKHFPDHEIERLKLGFLGQKPTVIHAYPSNKEI